jgi:hypothetical protein
MTITSRRGAFRPVLYCPDCKVVLYRHRFGCWWGQGREWTVGAIPAALVLFVLVAIFPISMMSFVLSMLGIGLAMLGVISIPMHLADKPGQSLCPDCGFGGSSHGRHLTETTATWIPAQEQSSGYWLFRDDFKRLTEHPDDSKAGDLTLLSGGRKESG